MRMYDNYSPLDLITRPLKNAIFSYEIKRLRWKPELNDLRRADWSFTWLIFLAEVVIFIVLLLASPLISVNGPFYFSIFDLIASTLVFIAPLAASVIVDIYTVSSTVTFWRAHLQADRMDVMRLTRPDDNDLLTILRASSELTVWRGMRWEMALRSLVAFCGIAASVLIGFVLFVSLPTSRPASTPASLVAILYFVWVFRMMRLYLLEPMWRMRALVAVSIAIAQRTNETNTAILIASAVALSLKVVQVAVVIMLLLITVRTPSSDLGPLSPAAQVVIWLIVSSAFTTRLVRLGYARLHAWCTWLTLRSLQGEDAALLDEVFQQFHTHLHRTAAKS